MNRSIKNDTGLWALIQARFNSQRLPGKVLRPLCGRQLLDRIVERARKISPAVNVAVITGDCSENRAIMDWCRVNTVDCFQGCENNVLHRYAQAAVYFKAATVVRLTADNPVFDFNQVNCLLDAHTKCGADYSSNKSEFGSGLPDGIGAEIFSTETLLKLDQMTLSASDREHVNDYILNHPDEFYCIKMGVSPDFSNHRFTIDTPADFEYMEKLLSAAPEKMAERSDFWKSVSGKNLQS